MGVDGIIWIPDSKGNCSVQFSLVTQLCPTLCDPMDCSTPCFPVYQQLPEFTQTRVHWVSKITQPPHPLLSPSPPAFNLSQHQGLFKWFCSLNQVAKVWSFSFNVSPSNEYSGLISFRMEWLDLLAVQGTLKSLLQHHSSKASILPWSAWLHSKSHIHTCWIPLFKFNFLHFVFWASVNKMCPKVICQQRFV